MKNEPIIKQMNNKVEIRVYNIDYEIYYRSREDYEMTDEEFDEYLEELHEDVIIEIDPEDIDWSMEYIKEYIVDYITDITGETFNWYDYEVLVDIREVKLNQLGI